MEGRGLAANAIAAVGRPAPEIKRLCCPKTSLQVSPQLPDTTHKHLRFSVARNYMFLGQVAIAKRCRNEEMSNSHGLALGDRDQVLRSPLGR